MADTREAVAKRRAERIKRIRRRRLFVSFFFLLFIALITVLILCFTVFFPINDFKVSGSKLYDKEQIIKGGGLELGDNLLCISEKQINEKIRTVLPYVDTVSIKREFPNTLHIKVKDAKEYAAYSINGKYYMISQSGYVLDCREELPQNTFSIICNDVKCELGKKAVIKNEKDEKAVNTLLTAFKDKEIFVNSVDVTETVELKATVEGRFEVNFGENEYIEEKIAHLEKMIENIGDRAGKINLSMWTPAASKGSFVEIKK